MIFVCVGSRQYQFNRLFQKLDELVEQGLIQEEIVAQIGASDYQPKHYKYMNFMSTEEFDEYIEKADMVISHGGTGSLIKALQLGKQVIAVTRLAKYEEHINDHQVQTNEAFALNKYVLAVYEMDELYGAIKAFREGTADIVRYYNPNPTAIIDLIDDFIQNSMKGIA